MLLFSAPDAPFSLYMCADELSFRFTAVAHRIKTIRFLVLHFLIIYLSWHLLSECAKYVLLSDLKCLSNLRFNAAAELLPNAYL